MKLLKNLSYAIMLLSLLFMIIAYINTNNINYVLGGLVVSAVATLLNGYAIKKMKEGEEREENA